MTKIFLTYFLVFIICIANCQTCIKTQVINSYHQVQSIDPLQTDFLDLEILGKAIGNSEIVFIGEQDHGDAPTFLAKVRIVKFLHEKMGFDVLVLESDFWGLNNVWDTYKNDSTLIDQIKKNTYSVWSQCQQTQELFNYVGSTSTSENPLIVSGMDCRHSLNFTMNNYINKLTEFLLTQKQISTDTAEVNFFLTITSELLLNEYNSKVQINQQKQYLEYLDSVSQILSDTFWKQEFKNLKGFAVNSWAKPFKSINRDICMADNLLWLYNEKYKGKKIIVWAHSTHIAKNISLIPDYVTTSTGNEVYKSLGESIYVLGFTSYKGIAGRVTNEKKFKVDKSRKNSIETWLNELNYDYGFVDFRTIDCKESFYMKGVRHISDKSNWTQIFDGVFYIEDMYPCEKAK